jgi:hypothetical protein
LDIFFAACVESEVWLAQQLVSSSDSCSFLTIANRSELFFPVKVEPTVLFGEEQVSLVDLVHIKLFDEEQTMLFLLVKLLSELPLFLSKPSPCLFLSRSVLLPQGCILPARRSVLSPKLLLNCRLECSSNFV